MRRCAGAFHPDSDQLKFVFKDWPWDGQDPRDLTKGADFLRLAPRGAPDDFVLEDAEQLELFPEGTPYGS